MHGRFSCGMGVGVLWVLAVGLAVVAAPDLPRDAVVEILAQSVLPGLGLSTDYVAFLYERPLLPGDRLSPYAPDPIPESVDRLPHLLPYDIGSPSWFCWVDLAPHARYAHPTMFVFVDAATGSVTLHSERWWPVLNGDSLWVDPSSYWTQDAWISASLKDGGGKPGGSGDAVCLPDAPGSDYYDWAIVVNGWSPGQPDEAAFAADAAGVCQRLGNLGMRVSTLPPGAANPGALEDFVIRLFTEIPLYKCCDRLYFYFIGHATPGSLWIGGHRLTASELARILSMPGDIYVPSRVNVFLETGYGGSFLESLATAGNIFRVWTASAADEPAYRDMDPATDPNPEDAGGEWTSSFLTTLDALLQADPLAMRSAEFGREYMPVNMAFDAACPSNSAVHAALSHPAGYLASDSDPDAFLAGIEYLARWDRAYHLLQGDLEETIDRYAEDPCQEMLWFLHNMARHDCLPEPSSEFNARIGKGHAKNAAVANWWEHCDLFWAILVEEPPADDAASP